MFSISNCLLALGLVAHCSAHLSMIHIQGSNGMVGHGFGVHTDGKYPRTGSSGDAGGDSTVFQTGTNNPSPACGRTPELGNLDIPAWLNQAEGFGLPAAYPNMSIVAQVFQVNRDGGGPMSCEYNSDALATSWKPMSLSLNQAGNDGIANNNRVNSTVVINFPQGAACNGGFTKTACIVRCRSGVNKRFGGCFAVKLSGSNSATTVNRAVASSSSSTLTTSQIDSIANTVIARMKSDGLLVSAASASSKKGKRCRGLTK